MAKIPKGIFGPFYGKIGPVVGSSWNGVPYIKSAPKQTGQKRQSTPLQIASQQKFKYTHQLMETFQPFPGIGFPDQNAFSYFYHHVVMGVYPGLSTDYSKILISRGGLAPLLNPEARLIAADTLKVSWTHGGQLAAYNDQVMLALYCPDENTVEGFVGGVMRRDDSCTYRMSPQLQGRALEVYIGLSSLNRKRAAEGQYLGRIEP